MNIAFIIFYFIFAVSGSTLLKYGGLEKVEKLFVIPFINLNISWVTLFGVVFYGLSFILYTILLNKFELSFISPVTVAGVYTLLMITAFVIFKEPITLQKMIGSILILVGLLFMTIGKK